jgi:zinc D-Ala-D-Ala carboxypeptidase
MYKYFNELQDPRMVGLDKKLMSMLDNAREIAGLPFCITSGVRSVYTNNQAGGVEDSSHLKGLACDIECNTSYSAFHIIRGALQAGFSRIGIGKGHIHLDIDATKPQTVLFLENHSSSNAIS